MTSLRRAIATWDHRTPDQADRFVFHQASALTNERSRGRLKLPVERTPTHVAEVGNTVANAIPIVPRERGGECAAGERVLLAGFGVGSSWGAALLDWRDAQLV